MTFHDGDLVEARKGETMIRGHLETKNGALCMPGYSTPVKLDIAAGLGWTFTLIEAAMSPLPAESGFYIESPEALSLTAVWYLAPNGKWLSAADPKYDGRAAEFAPFTRLEPVADTARDVLREVAKFAWADGFGPQLNKVAERFGVTQ